MDVGKKIKIKDNVLKCEIIGIVTEMEACYFKIKKENGHIVTFHWNDDIEIEKC